MRDPPPLAGHQPSGPDADPSASEGRETSHEPTEPQSSARSGHACSAAPIRSPLQRFSRKQAKYLVFDGVLHRDVEPDPLYGLWQPRAVVPCASLRERIHSPRRMTATCIWGARNPLAHRAALLVARLASRRGAQMSKLRDMCLQRPSTAYRRGAHPSLRPSAVVLYHS